MKLKIYTEECCDLCNEIVHNHLDCPVCKKEYSESEQYGDISCDPEYEIECSNCHTVFITKDEYPYWSEAEWEIKEHGGI